MIRNQKKSYTLNDFLEYPNFTLGLAFFKPFNQPNLKFSPISQALMIIGPVISTVHFIEMCMRMFLITDKSIPWILQISDRGSACGLGLISMCKMIVMFLYRTEMTKLVAELVQYYPGNLKIHNSFHRSVYKVQEFYDFSRSLMRTAYITLITIWFLLSFLSLFQSLLESLVFGRSYKLRLALDSPFQWDEESVGVYILNYLFQTYASINLVSFHMAGDFMLCFFLTQLRMHYEFLVSMLETTDAVVAEKDPECLRFLISYHARLERMVKKINEIFDVSFLVNFAISSIAMCLMGYSTLMGISIHDMALYSMGLITFLIFTLFICYNGNKLTESTEKLLPAAFYHNWYDTGPLYRKTILIFMMGSTKPRILQAYKFAPVSMATCMSIIKFSYQLFTCFRALG